MEETKFNRGAYMEAPNIEVRPDSKTCDENPKVLESQDRHSGEAKRNDNKNNTNANGDLSSQGSRLTAQMDDASQHWKKSYVARLKPIESQGFRCKNNVLRLMGRPILLLSFPIIAYAGFCYGCNIVWLSVLNATESMVLSAAPYSMSTSVVGLTFIAPLIGTSLA